MQPTTPGTWHVARGGQTYGPYTWEQIVEHTSGGRIGRYDKILDPRTGAWVKPSQVPGLLGSGGAAVIPAGLSTVAKIAVGILLSLATVTALVALSIQYAQTTNEDWSLNNWVDTWVSGTVQDDTPVTSATGGVVPPEGLAFQGMYHYQNSEGDRDVPCRLWIYMYDGATCASFDYDIHDWPVYLVSQDGSHYVFESSTRSFVERWRIEVDITETSMSGTITSIENTREERIVGPVTSGTFTGTAITYEQYQAFD